MKNTNQKQKYLAPTVKMVDCKVERGFAISGTTQTHFINEQELGYDRMVVTHNDENSWFD